MGQRGACVVVVAVGLTRVGARSSLVTIRPLRCRGGSTLCEKHTPQGAYRQSARPVASQRWPAEEQARRERGDHGRLSTAVAATVRLRRCKPRSHVLARGGAARQRRGTATHLSTRCEERKGALRERRRRVYV
jgi:hypothetical protein